MGIISDYSDGTPAISFTLRDKAGKILVQRGGDQIYYAASTIKLAVAMALIQDIDAGKYTWDQTIPATHKFASARGGYFSLADDPDEVDELLPPVGTPMNLEELLHAMIERSSNEATNMILDLIGIHRVQRLCKDCGMTRLHIERRIGDLAARNHGTPNEVTTNDLSKLMLTAITGNWANGPEMAVLQQALSHQHYPVIADVLPSNMTWGSKSGSVTGIEHDVAFVMDPDDESLYVLAVCTRAYAPQEAQEAIRSICAAALRLYAE